MMRRYRGSGLLIYHIDDAVYGNNNQWYPGRTGSGHYQVALEQADALWQIEQIVNQGNSGDPYPGSSNNRNYNASSSPNSKNYADQLTGIAVQNISNSASTMTADLFGSQPPSVTLTAPNGGETWYVGDADTIRWSSTGFSGNVAIEINRSYPAGAWTAITSSASNTGSYRWVVTSGTTSAASIRVRSINVPSARDSSDAVFAIAPRSVTVTAPNTAVTWLVGDSADITWTSQNMSENVSIEINRTYPSATWTMLASSVANAGTYRWLVSSPTGGTARIRVSGTTHTSVRDTSNTNFTIGSRSLTVTSPNTAVTWVAGDTANIQWSSSNMAGEPVLIELNRNYPADSWETIAASTANDGSHLWPITGSITTAARVRITGTSHTSVTDVSNVNFNIARRTITVSRPNTNITFIIGGPDTIRWASANMSGNVRVELNRGYPNANWETLATSVSNSGWYRWDVAGQASTNARVRVSAVNYSGIADTSDADFTITSASLTLLGPNGGEVKFEGDPDTIRWSSTNLSENIRIDLNRSYPTGSWATIVTSAPNTGSYVRNMPSGITTTARLRIVAINHPSIADTSDANFTVARRSVTVTAPNSAMTWIVGDSADVIWTSQNLTENVTIEINRTYPSVTWTSIATNIANSGSYRCLVTAPTGASTRIRVSGTTHTSVRDTSDTNFSISQRSITVNAPNTATTLVIGDAANITWSAPLLTEPVLIELNRSYPSGSWETIAASTPNDGSQPWTVTGPITTAARVRITGTEHTGVTDVSNVNFTIGQRTIAVTRPNTNITMITGGPDTIRWTSTNMPGNVRVELNRGFPDGTWEVLASSASNAGSYIWNVAGAQSTTARVRVSAVNFASVADTSDTDFTIATATLTLLTPNGGETLYEGDPDTMRWSSTNLNENVRIDLNRTYPSTNWVTIVPSAPNTGSYVRNMPSGITTTARLRVVAINHQGVSDTSDANFSVARRSLTITSPNTAVTWAVGDSNDITWTSQNLSENMNIEINRSYPSSTWTTIAANVENSGTYRWLVSTPTSGTARIRVSGATHSAVRDTSNTNFTIAQRSITVSVPNSNVVWAAGDSASILWTTACMGNEPVKIELNRNYPSGTWEAVVESTPNDGTHRCFVSEPITTTARIRITGTVHMNVADESNTNFTIARRSITVTKPNGGEVWVSGRADTIRWTSANMSGNVAIALNRNFPSGTWETITSSAANNGWYRWVTGGALTENARVRVTAVNFVAIGDTSNAAFAIRVSGAAPSTPGGFSVDGIAGNTVVPTELALVQNFPNPFNASTQIRFALPLAGYVSVTAYDLLGRKVSTILRGERNAGWHEISWQATDDAGRSLPTGTYLIQMISGEFMQTRKVVLMR
ncbi:MAG: T9SS type A sorting domain-containing protein [bacterium]|nr:T9SS type A sorting domain-containing protein [bacterium]